MGLQVNSKDSQLERWVAEFVRRTVLEFKDLTFKQSVDKASIWDFGIYQFGNLHLGNLDVKVRDGASTDYDSYFLSVEKYESCRTNYSKKHYVVYAFTKDRVIKIFDLEAVRCTPKEIDYTHKRTGQPMTKWVYLVPANKALVALRLPAKK